MLLVLMYHYIGVPHKDTLVKGLFVKPQHLDKHLAYLKKKNFRFINFEDLTTENYSPDDKNVIITFDDGSRDLYTEAFPILQKHKAKATIYPVINNLGKTQCTNPESYDQSPLDYMTKDELKEMSRAGIEFGSHLMNHIHLSRYSKDIQEKEISDSLDALTSLTDKPVYSIAYPYGDYNAESLEVCQSLQLPYGVTTKGGFNAHLKPLEIERQVIKGQKWRHWFRFRNAISRFENQ